VISPGPLAQRSMKESWAQWSLKRGVESLPESITEYLQQSGRVELHKDAAVKQIHPSASGWKVCERVVEAIYLNIQFSIQFNSFYLYSANLQQLSSQGT